jgi:hypothetical protein
MPPDISVQSICRIWVTPWERGQFGVAYEFPDGKSACHAVGSKAEAEAVVEEVERRCGASGDNVVDMRGTILNNRRD